MVFGWSKVVTSFKVDPYAWKKPLMHGNFFLIIQVLHVRFWALLPFEFSVHDVGPVIIKSVCSTSFDPRDFQRLEETSGIDEVQTSFRFGCMQNILVDPVSLPKSKC